MIPKHILDQADRYLQKKAQELAAEIKRNLSKPGTGRIYPTHRASAPGEPPAPDTGALRDSVHISKPAEGVRRVGVGTVYAHGLEFGSRNVAPRPFMRPSIRKIKGG